jgi:hypothetical protein
MATHKFKVGETVELRSGGLDRNAPRGFYRIERLLPVESRIVQYRVKHITDGHERVVTEGHLSMPQPQDVMTGSPDLPGPEQSLRWRGPNANPALKRA